MTAQKEVWERLRVQRKRGDTASGRREGARGEIQQATSLEAAVERSQPRIQLAGSLPIPRKFFVRSKLDCLLLGHTTEKASLPKSPPMPGSNDLSTPSPSPSSPLISH